MGKIKVLTLVLTKLDIELGLAQPQLVSRFFHHRQKFGIKIGKIGWKTATFSSILPHTPFIFLDYRGYWNCPDSRNKNRAVSAVCPNSGQNPNFPNKGRLWAERSLCLGFFVLVGGNPMHYLGKGSKKRKKILAFSNMGV